MVVLPLVPVTPSTRIAADGWPYRVAASGPERGAHARHPGLRHRQRQRALDEQRHRAPGDGLGARGRGRRSDAPGMHAKHAPGSTRRLSWVMASTSTSGSPVSSNPPSSPSPGPVETGEQVVPTHACASSRLGHGNRSEYRSPCAATEHGGTGPVRVIAVVVGTRS